MDFIDRFDRRITLTEGRWSHIKETHLMSIYTKETYFALQSEWIMGSIVTAYTDRIKNGEVIWRKN